MIEIIAAVILIIAAGGSIWYTLRQTGKSQAAVEASQAQARASDARVEELERLRQDIAIKEKAKDEDQASKVTDATGAIDFLRESFKPRNDSDKR